MNEDQLELQKLWNLIDETIACPKRSIERKLRVINRLLNRAQAISTDEADAMAEWVATSYIGG